MSVTLEIMAYFSHFKQRFYLCLWIWQSYSTHFEWPYAYLMLGERKWDTNSNTVVNAATPVCNLLQRLKKAHGSFSLLPDNTASTLKQGSTVYRWWMKKIAYFFCFCCCFVLLFLFFNFFLANPQLSSVFQSKVLFIQNGLFFSYHLVTCSVLSFLCRKLFE